MTAQQQGVSLVELLVAMTIGVFLVGAIGSVYIGSKDTYRTSETIARLQENSRTAMRIVAEDIQMAGFLGNSTNPALVEGRAGSSTALPHIGSDCVTQWYVDMSNLLVIGNNSAPVVNGTSFAGECMNGVNYLAGTDVIAVKRAATGEIPTDGAGRLASPADHPGWLILRTDSMRGEFFIGGEPEPGGFMPAVTTNRRWLAHIYHIARDTDDAELPVLRRLRLGSGPEIHRDQELVRGIQDLQIQLGIDTDGDGDANTFVEPGDEGVSPVVAARIWILARSEQREPGHDDSINTYEYANRVYIPGNESSDNDSETANDPEQYRRLLLTRTVALRNHW